MDADLTVPKPKNIDLASACTLGVGFYVRKLAQYYHLAEFN
jgi:hypothetical protein